MMGMPLGFRVSGPFQRKGPIIIGHKGLQALMPVCYEGTTT